LVNCHLFRAARQKSRQFTQAANAGVRLPNRVHILENKTIVVFSFKSGSLTPEVIASLIEFGIGFEAKYINSDLNNIRSGNCNIFNRLSKLRKATYYRRIELKEKNGDECPSLYIRKESTYDLLRIKYHNDSVPEQTFFDYLSQIDGFNFGYMEDLQFNYWENLKVIALYDLHNKSHSHLPKKSNGKPYPIEQTIIDISNNVCRNIEFLGMLFSLSPRVWFNQEYLQRVLPHFFVNENLFIDKRMITSEVFFIKLCKGLKPLESDLESINIIANDIDLAQMEKLGYEKIRKATTTVNPVPGFTTLTIGKKGSDEQVIWVNPL
jgi:hypothetical protein